MEGLFISVLNMSISACIVIAVVIALRLILRRAPKAFFCILWAFVGLRLICPFTLQSVLSLIPDSQPMIEQAFSDNAAVRSETSADAHVKQTQRISERPSPSVPQTSQFVTEEVTPQIAAEHEQTVSSVTPQESIHEEAASQASVPEAPPVNIFSGILHALPYIWAAGAVLMFIGALVRYFITAHRLRGASEIEKGVFVSGMTDTPFILGIISPKIYLPEGTDADDIEYILAHERAHLCRLDHLWKPVGFAILCLHWFDPMVWLAFGLFCRDVELACDERVVRDYSQDKRKRYSHALVKCSEQKKTVNYLPLGFGESGVKERVVNVLSYKRPALWIIIICALAAAGVGVFFMTRPVTSDDKTAAGGAEEPSSKESRALILPEGEPDTRPEVPEETPLGTVTGADAFIYADDWKLELNNSMVTPADGSTGKRLNTGKEDDTSDTKNWSVYYGKEHYDVLIYQHYLALGAAKPDMRKITAREFVDILTSTAYDDEILRAVADDKFEFDRNEYYYDTILDPQRSRSVFDAVQAIQYFPDGYDNARSVNAVPLNNKKYILPLYYYWPDSNERSGCRTQLCMNFNTMTLTRSCFDEYGDLESSECLYSYTYELERAAFKSCGCSEERYSRRLPSPYTKTVYTSPTYPEGDKKLKGKEVLVPEEVTNSINVKTRYHYYAKLVAAYESLFNKNDIIGGGTLEYQKQVSYGNAYPNMQKITSDEIAAIFDGAKIYEGIDYNNIQNCRAWVMNNIEEIKKIQYFPDVDSSSDPYDSFQMYWPDADTPDKRRQEVQIFGNGLVRVAEYDENGDRISYEDVFDLSKKVRDIDSGNGRREPYPITQKLTEEDVERIFGSVEVDPELEVTDSYDKEVCRRFMEPYMEEIKKIQSIPDAYYPENDQYIYYPDANSIKDRRIEIIIIPEKAYVSINKFKGKRQDDNDLTEPELVSTEFIFNLHEYLFRREQPNYGNTTSIPEDA